MSMCHVECYQPSQSSDVQEESIGNSQLIGVLHWVMFACICPSSTFYQQMSGVCHFATTHALWMSMRNPQKQISPIHLSLRSTSTWDRTCSDILTDSNTDFEVYVWIGKCSTASLPGRHNCYCHHDTSCSGLKHPRTTASSGTISIR